MILLISSENKVPNYEVDDAGHQEILFLTQKLQRFSKYYTFVLACRVIYVSVV